MEYLVSATDARHPVPIMLRLPPRVWALTYLAVAAKISQMAAWDRHDDLQLVPLGVILIAVGIALAVSAVVLFRRAGTEINPTSAANRVLVTSGPFRVSRNPMYLSLVCVALGIAFWVGAWPMFLAPVAVFATANWVHIPFEEAKMRRQFGAAFDAYAGKVRRWI
jgi:protein-S-isoprenylcysteine O-methyltransferase Ste14